MDVSIQSYLLLGLLSVLTFYVGALVFGSGAVAPLVIRVLGEQTGGPLLRAYWPRYHAFAVAGGVLITIGAAVVSFMGDLTTKLALGYLIPAAVMTILFAIGWRLIPAINAARDEGENARFDRLHKLDVMLVSVGMLLGLGLAVAMLLTFPDLLS
ncbi:MAG: DUF4149 domain-containing protein [Pseudomonadota bacterium]